MYTIGLGSNKIRFDCMVMVMHNPVYHMQVQFLILDHTLDLVLVQYISLVCLACEQRIFLLTVILDSLELYHPIVELT